MDEKQKLNQLEHFVADHEVLMQSMNRRLSMVENIGTAIGILSLLCAGSIITLFIIIISKGLL